MCNRNVVQVQYIFDFRNGYGHHLDRLFPFHQGFLLRGDEAISTGDHEDDSEHSEANYKCTVRLNKQERSQHLENCDTCSKARLEHLKYDEMMLTYLLHAAQYLFSIYCRNRQRRDLNNLLSIIIASGVHAVAVKMKHLFNSVLLF